MGYDKTYGKKIKGVVTQLLSEKINGTKETNNVEWIIEQLCEVLNEIGDIL